MMLRVKPQDEHVIPLVATQHAGRTPGRIDPRTKVEATKTAINVVANRMARQDVVNRGCLLTVILIYNLLSVGVLFL